MAPLYKIFIDVSINGEYVTEEIPCWVNDLDKIHIMLPIKVEFVPRRPAAIVKEENEPRVDPANE